MSFSFRRPRGARSSYPYAADALRRSCAAAVESLEMRQLMSVTAVDPAAVANGTPYSLLLHRTAGESGATIDWGDGSALGTVTFTSSDDASTSHTYAQTGPVDITITPTVTANGPSDGTVSSKTVTAVDPAAVFAAFAQQGSNHLAGGTVDGELAVARFLADGSLDPTFGTGGYFKFAAPNGAASGVINSIAVAPDGSIVAVGTSTFGDFSTQLVALRIGQNGSLAESYAATDPASSTGNDVALDGIGGFHVAGSTGSLAQLLHFGSGPLSAGPDLARTTNPAGADLGVSVAVSGSRIALGIITSGTSGGIAVFGPTGDAIETLPLSTLHSVQDVAFDAGGGVLVAGSANRPGDPNMRDGVLARFDYSSGPFDFDANFGDGGIAVVPTGVGTDVILNNIQVLTDGSILGTGSFINNNDLGNTETLAVRFTSGGDMDPTFDGDGYTTFGFGAADPDADPNYPWQSIGYFIQENGDRSITVAGAPDSNSGQGAVVLFAELAPTGGGGGGGTPQTLHVKLVSASVSDGVLAVAGTGGNDTITVSVGSDNSLSLSVDGVSIGSFSDSARVTINAGAGNDIVTLVGLTVGADVFGGAGNDIILGGNGGGVLVGGDGNDAVTGGSGRDLLLGGNGADALLAGGGEDVLVAGRTSYDSNPTALGALRTVWQRTDLSFTQRVSNISNGNGVTGGYALRTDGGNQTVFDDSAADTLSVDLLFGGGSGDYFLYNFQQTGTRDIVLDLNGKDIRADIDPT